MVVNVDPIVTSACLAKLQSSANVPPILLPISLDHRLYHCVNAHAYEETTTTKKKKNKPDFSRDLFVNLAVYCDELFSKNSVCELIIPHGYKGSKKVPYVRAATNDLFERRIYFLIRSINHLNLFSDVKI